MWTPWRQKRDRTLSPEVLREAYSSGYFPMGDAWTRGVRWYRPDPRAILPLDEFHCSRRLARRIRRGEFQVEFNQAFRQVMLACADRPDRWITDEILTAYQALREEGDAHSVEILRDGELVGGVYGVSLGGAFFGESMFHRATDASKVALHHLVQRLNERGFALLEIQYLSEHLASLGGVEIPDDEYQDLLARALAIPTTFA
ncbi:MAG: leucyl/phenylalanyl-tRNA--protein transferase [Planctomycetales bacterium]